MLMALKGSQYTLMIRKNLRNAHIIKSYIVPRKSYIGKRIFQCVYPAFLFRDKVHSKCITKSS